MNPRNFWLALAILGAVIPWYYFAIFFAGNSWSLSAFLSAAAVNNVTRGMSWDLIIASLAFWVYLFARRADGPMIWPFVLLNLFIGLSCALPAYFWAASKRSAAESA